MPHPSTGELDSFMQPVHFPAAKLTVSRCRLKGQPRSWLPVGKAELILVKQQPVTFGHQSSTAYIKVSTGEAGGGLSNTGYWGIPVQKDQQYQLSVIIQSETTDAAADKVCSSACCHALQCMHYMTLTLPFMQCSWFQQLQQAASPLLHTPKDRNSSLLGRSSQAAHLLLKTCGSTVDSACTGQCCMHRQASFQPKLSSSMQASQVTVKLESTDGKTVYASADINNISSGWKHPKVMLTSNGTDPSAQLTMYINGAADVSLKMVSLWPAENVKGEVLQPFRPDLLQYLKDLKPRCDHLSSLLS